MKKTIVAAVLLLLLLIGTLFNIRCLDGSIEQMQGYVGAAQGRAEAGDYDGAVASLRQAIELWNGIDGYSHIFIRHSEIDGASDAFYDLLGDLYARDADSAKGSFEKALYHLESISKIEHITLGSVF
jgi:hypothetical protein